MKPACSNRRGIALVLVLLVVSIISALTLQLNRDIRLEVYEAANLGDGIRLRYVAESGFQAAEAILLADKNSYDALTESWANTRMLSLKSEDFFENGAFSIAIEDEGGKININRLITGNAYSPPVKDMLLRLLAGPDFRMEQRKAEELVDAIKDWIDADDEATGAGAESGYYAALERPYAVKNAPLDCIEELLMIKGVTRELFYGAGKSPGLAGCLTVAGDGLININTAPKPVLGALAAEMTAGLADKFDEYRRDAKNDLADPLWYRKVPGAAGLTIPAGTIAIKSDHFLISSVGLQGRMATRVAGVVKREADRRKVRLLSWKVE